MAVSADQLKKTGATGSKFDLFVREQIGLIDDKLQRHDRRWGRNVVSYELPTRYIVPGLELQDVQRILYSQLIQHYKDQGFEVRLLLDSQRPYTLYLAWVTDLAKERIDAMNRIIKGALITADQLEAFCAADTNLGGAAAADTPVSGPPAQTRPPGGPGPSHPPDGRP